MSARVRARVYTVTYSPQAEADFRRMSLEVAQNICREVHAAATGEPVHIQTDDKRPSLMTIFGDGGFASVRVDARGMAFNVSRLVADVPIDPGVALLDEPEPPPSSR